MRILLMHNIFPFGKGKEIMSYAHKVINYEQESPMN